MTLIDSNILIRIITGDTPRVALRLLNIIESAGKNEYYITSSVFVEVCFVLEFHDYAMGRKDICAAINRLIGSPQIYCSDTSVKALDYYKKYPKLDYTDCYLLALAKEKPANILTLDKYLQKLV
jgi:predicted nucleic acid-binding protein